MVRGDFRTGSADRLREDSESDEAEAVEESMEKEGDEDIAKVASPAILFFRRREYEVATLDKVLQEEEGRLRSIEPSRLRRQTRP